MIPRLNHSLPTLAARSFESLRWFETRDLLVPSEAAVIAPSDNDFFDFLKRVSGKSDALIQRLAKKEITPREWADQFKLLLNDGHASAWILGRRRAGNLGAATIDDTLIGVAYGDSQADFLLGFLDDIENGRYTDEAGSLIERAVQVRANLYAQVMRGTSGSGFVASSPPESEFKWVLGMVEEHCTDCPELADLNPWTESTLFAFPGDGTTQCLGNCKCHLERQDGLASFKPVTLN